MQDIIALRFANTIFEPIWNRNYVQNVQITSAESLGVEERGGYYDHAGALRDMIQNHVINLLALVAMEPPISSDADDIRNEKYKVLSAIEPPSPADVWSMSARGQYGPGTIDGRPVKGYREEDDVAPDSNTDTYAAVKFYIENWRWAGVPFYLRSGKRLAAQDRRDRRYVQADSAPLLRRLDRSHRAERARDQDRARRRHLDALRG